MQDIGTLSQYINDYGPFIVILAVFLIIFLCIIGYILRANKKYIQENSELNRRLIDSLLNVNKYMEDKQPHYDEKNIVDIFMELNKTLKNECDQIINKTRSDRSAIYVFHNGSCASHGLPFFKMSCVSESISKYSNSNIKLRDHTEIQLNFFESIVSNLYNNSEYRIQLDKTSDPSDIIFLQNTKIKDCFFIPIYSDDNNMMGFVFNGYNMTDENRDVKAEHKYLTELARMVKPVIEYSNFQKYQSGKEE